MCVLKTPTEAQPTQQVSYLLVRTASLPRLNRIRGNAQPMTIAKTHPRWPKRDHFRTTLVPRALTRKGNKVAGLCSKTRETCRHLKKSHSNKQTKSAYTVRNFRHFRLRSHYTRRTDANQECNHRYHIQTHASDNGYLCRER